MLFRSTIVSRNEEKVENDGRNKMISDNVQSLEPHSSNLYSPLANKTIAILGGGPCGLATAIMLSRFHKQNNNPNESREINIQVYDRLPRPDPPSSERWEERVSAFRSYALGIGGRGQKILMSEEILGNIWQQIEPYTAVACGRKDWNPQGEQPEKVYTHKEYQTKVIQRDRLIAEIGRAHV